MWRLAGCEARPDPTCGCLLALFLCHVAAYLSEMLWRTPAARRPLKASSSLEAVKFSGLLSVIVMTYPYINDPKYWRERGEEARSIAKLLDDQEAKRQMLAIAASYDRLSDHMKQRPRKLRK